MRWHSWLRQIHSSYEIVHTIHWTLNIDSNQKTVWHKHTRTYTYTRIHSNVHCGLWIHAYCILMYNQCLEPSISSTIWSMLHANNIKQKQFFLPTSYFVFFPFVTVVAHNFYSILFQFDDGFLFRCSNLISNPFFVSLLSLLRWNKPFGRLNTEYYNG